MTSSPSYKLFLAIPYLLPAVFMLTLNLSAQEFDAQRSDETPGFLLFLDFSYDENQKSVEQTGYSDTDQKTAKNGYVGGVGYIPFFLLATLHQERSIDTSYGSGETTYTNRLDGYGLWGLLFFGIGEIKLVEDYEVTDSNENLIKEKSELSIATRAGFIPISLENPLFVAYSESNVNFTYGLTVGDTHNVEEDVDFKVNMVHVFKVIRETDGPSIGGMINYITSFETLDNRDGEIEGTQYGLELGYLAKSGFAVKIGGARQDAKIEIDSETNDGTLTRMFEEESTLFSIRIPITEEMHFIAEQKNLKKYSLNRDSFDYFESKKEAFDQTTSFGIILNKNLRMDLSFGSYRIKHRDENNVLVDYEPVNKYSLSDRTVGIKIKYRFAR